MESEDVRLKIKAKLVKPDTHQLSKRHENVGYYYSCSTEGHETTHHATVAFKVATPKLHAESEYMAHMEQLVCHEKNE